jgi:hypothetical protein
MNYYQVLCLFPFEIDFEKPFDFWVFGKKNVFGS